MNQTRADRCSGHRAAFDRNARKILMTQDICGICGKPVDKSLRYPDPQAASVDHIIPIARGGHPSDISNLQLAHWICNRAKGDMLCRSRKNDVKPEDLIISNRNLPQNVDWSNYKAD